MENELLNQPRRTLIGRLKGERIMFITPLLKWYLEHGLKVTAIYKVIEYIPPLVVVVILILARPS